MLDLRRVTGILKLWGVRHFEILPNEFVPGSPERNLSRVVVEDAKGKRFVLEQLALEAFENKTVIAERVDRLQGHGLSVISYIKGADGHWIQRHDGFCWQLAPLCKGVPLNRDRYWNEGWRGEATAHFLADLSTASRHWKLEGAVFSLPGYIEELVQRIERHDPEYLPGLQSVIEFLHHRFYPVVDEVTPAFCHGDPHPVNTIWGEDRIVAVIDWEFCGWKPKLYDAALVVGCVGAEAPGARHGDFILAFGETLKLRRLFSEEETALLPLFVIAVRFGWLSEWLRRKDVEMIEFELFYMDLLMAQLNTHS